MLVLKTSQYSHFKVSSYMQVELSPSDENEIQTSWQELYFQISSDTYEKVDAAIAVIELLISSVSVSR